MGCVHKIAQNMENQLKPGLRGVGVGTVRRGPRN